MNKKLVVGAAAAAVLTLGVGTAYATQQSTPPTQNNGPAVSGTAAAPEENEAVENEAREGKDSEESLSGSPAQQAAGAAFRATNGGTVLEVEQGDDPGAAYEVEIRKADGGITEVMLDSDFNVIDQTAGD